MKMFLHVIVKILFHNVRVAEVNVTFVLDQFPVLSAKERAPFNIKCPSKN